MRLLRASAKSLVICLALTTQSALACSVAPPPSPPPQAADESDAEYSERVTEFHRLRREETAAQIKEFAEKRTLFEEELWRDSKRVFLARIVGYGRTRITVDGYRTVQQTVVLKPTQSFKGKGSNRRFELAPIILNSCYYPGNGTALFGAKGDLFLVFARANKPSTRTVIETLALDEVKSERSKAALADRR